MKPEHCIIHPSNSIWPHLSTYDLVQEYKRKYQRWGQRGLEAKISRLGFVLVLMQREGCPSGLVVSLLSVIEITSLRFVIL